MSKNLYGFVVATLLCTVLLAGCGRKGALEPPPAAEISATDETAPSQENSQPDRPFILDRLIR